MHISLFAWSQRLQNPSFEDPNFYFGEGKTPPFWTNCGDQNTPPDTQPGAWGVTLPAEHGRNYLGMVFRTRDNGTYESVSQNLSIPFHKDSAYTFEVSLAFDPHYEGYNFRKPGILRIFGGNSLCATTENLWNSPIIDHQQWRTYLVSLSPSATYSTITLEAYFAQMPIYNGDVLVDNIRNIKAHVKPSFSLGEDVVVCGQEYVIDATAAQGPYVWQDGSTKSSLKVTASGEYWVQTYVNGFNVSDTIHVTIDQPFAVELGEDIVLCKEYPAVVLSANIPDASYLWSDQSVSASLTATESGTYWLEVSKGSCVERDSISITYKDCRLFIPNVITPNGDGINDFFVVTDDYEEGWRLEIFNRWGTLLYYSPQYDNSWNGEGYSNGIYYIILRSNTTPAILRSTLSIIR